MGGGENLPGFPKPNPTTSYWQLPPHRIANQRTTENLPTSTVFDYVIVGSGISGASIAYKLLTRDPSLSILMLEARTAASAASGRNGGNCRPGWWLNFKNYVEAFGEDETIKFERLEEDNVEDIAAFVREHEVDCDFREVQTADCFMTEHEWTKTLEMLKLREEVTKRKPELALVRKKTVWEGQQAEDHMGMPSLAGAVTYSAYTQNPYRLVCKMLELSLDKGMNLQTNTLALSVVATTGSNSPAKWKVVTDRGIVKAKQTVLATNSYTNAIYPNLASTGFLTPAKSQLTAIRPGNQLSQRSLSGSRTLDDINATGDYYLTREAGLQGEGDIIYGGGRFITKELGTTDDTQNNPQLAKYLHGALARYFGPQHWGEGDEVVRDWCGITCYTPDTFPLVGEAPGQDGLWVSVGMNGHGMAMAFRCAEALVEMMVAGTTPEWFPHTFRLERAWD